MDSEVQIKRIVLDRMERCAVCHREFQPHDITVIARKPRYWTMMVECEDCHARNFVAAMLGDGDQQEAQLALRRLTESAIHELKHNEPPAIQSEAPSEAGDPITASDVVDIHEFLDGFDGDFQQLFRAG
jgi:hypothetical protein